MKATPLRALAVFGLATIKVSVLLEFKATLAGAKDLLTLGGPTTVRLALEVLPLPPLAEVTTTLLFFTPAVVPVTLPETVQEAP